VCMKWVALRPDIDPLTGSVSADDRWSGPSLADQAALEIALQLAAVGHDHVHVVTVGTPSAEAMLRNALAAGASSATRIHAHEHASSPAVAAAIAEVIRPLQARLVVCGDWSLDRGSGSVPPFLAAELDYGQACGLVSVSVEGEASQPSVGSNVTLLADRRLDGGRRERVRISGPAVLSVEGSVAILRRATLSGTLAAQKLTIALVTPKHALAVTQSAHRIGPFRPRARVLDGPATSESPRARIEQLTGALTNRKPPQKLTLEPQAAAEAILEQLTEWGYDF
jgi:electron transfer flavoprotein beta subunit